jgi:hypothetical protein
VNQNEAAQQEDERDIRHVYASTSRISSQSFMNPSWIREEQKHSPKEVIDLFLVFSECIHLK